MYGKQTLKISFSSSKDYTLNFIKTDLNFFWFSDMISLDVCRLAVDANECCLIVAHNNVVINLNINDSFISSRNISTSTSVATVTKDSWRWWYENNLYFTDTSNKSHSNSFNLINRILLFRRTTYQQRQLLDPIELFNHPFTIKVKNHILCILFFLLFLIVFIFMF